MQTDNEKYNETVQPNTAFLNELKAKLPEFFTKEGSFDLDKFRNQLKDKNINELSEGYQLDFIGKDYARRQAGEMPTTVIVPDEKQNQGEGKNSKNLFFTGDNLEVLRHLQNNYQNKIDVIYIDPPYNTGSDGFVYPDSFEYSDDKLKDMFGLDDDQVERLKSIQGKSSHSAWLTFMYPRLFLVLVGCSVSFFCSAFFMFLFSGSNAIDYSTRKSYVTTKLFFIANMIKHNTRSSRELLKALKGDPSVLATVPEKELFNRSTLDKKSLSKMAEDHKTYIDQHEFFDSMDKTFNEITEKL